MISTADVEAELNKSEEAKRTIVQNVGMLALSLILYASAGLFRSSLSSVVMIIVVLLIHEFGHWFGMRLFGYRDLRMFFIPFFGAAVSGRESVVSSERRAIVALLGPVPGLVLGCLGLWTYLNVGQPWLLQYALVSLFLNGFNLLPIYPLDGGRFLEAIFFARFPIAELFFKLLAAAALGLLAYYFRSLALGVLSFATLVLAREGFVQSQIVRQLRMQFKDQPAELPERIPHEQLKSLLPQLMRGLPPDRVKAKTLAARARGVWQRFILPKPHWGATLALLGLYFLMPIIGVVSAYCYNIATTRIEVSRRTAADGSEFIVEEIYRDKHKTFEVGLDKLGYYSGPSTTWNRGIVTAEGPWWQGYQNGEWTYYNASGGLDSVRVYEKGRVVAYKKFVDGSLIEKAPENWPFAVKYGSHSLPKRYIKRTP